MNPFAAILACLLALLVASPGYCRATDQGTVACGTSCGCCCGEDDGRTPGHRCLCATEDPHELPDPMTLPPPGKAAMPVCPPASGRVAVPPPPGAPAQAQSWAPALPWHAPPGTRRALLVRRTI